ncbi:HK97 gp10 family phage protein [Cytobacillus oceanisediminis]|uniref:HK97 gp10 family phage protein n=1 Tax=Cytobacillus oceanisediminis TaxID=665099 RepID=UPI001CCAE8C8|nr:HK97 gp10 family phage protein [Cytobacillus oceanisediminis]MBZ9536283.1 HK97 gp10 family phage protein [Cytobacillus oceanisediminis]
MNQLQNEIMRQLNIYTNEVQSKVKLTQEELGKEAVQKLKKDSPKLTGSYRKGWRLKKEKDKVIIHNATDYQLTHLLEKGHANRNGGRTPAQVHIAPVEEKVVDEYIKRVERDIESS